MANFFINSRFTPSATIKVDLFDDDNNSLATDIVATHDALGQFEVNAGTHNWLYDKVFYEFNSIKHFCETQYNTNFSQGVQGLTTAQATQLTNVENQLTTNRQANLQSDLDAYTNKDDWKATASTPPTATTIATAVRTELTTELGRIDENVSATKDSNIVSVNGTATTSIEDFQDFTSSDDTKINNLISSFNRVKHSMIVTETTATTSASASAGLNQITLNLSENAYFTSTLFVDSYCLLSPDSFTNDPLNNFQLLKITSQDTNPSEANKIRITFDENITNFTSGNSLKVMFLRGQFNEIDLSTIETALTTNRQANLQSDLDAYTNKDDWKATGSGGGSGLTTAQNTALNDIKSAVVDNRESNIHADLDSYTNKDNWKATSTGLSTADSNKLTAIETAVTTNRRTNLHGDLDNYANKDDYKATLPTTYNANILQVNGNNVSSITDFHATLSGLTTAQNTTLNDIKSAVVDNRESNMHSDLDSYANKNDFKATIPGTINANVVQVNSTAVADINEFKSTDVTQSVLHGYLDNYANKDDFKATIPATINANITQVVGNNVGNINDFKATIPTEIDANLVKANGVAVVVNDFKATDVTESVLHGYLDNYTNKDDWKATTSGGSGLTTAQNTMLDNIKTAVVDNREANAHADLDSYANKNDWKADALTQTVFNSLLNNTPNATKDLYKGAGATSSSGLTSAEQDKLDKILFNTDTASLLPNS